MFGFKSNVLIHRDAVKGAIYNSTFQVTVSVDEGGTVCVWNMQNGSRESRFRAVTSESARITAMTFDKNERRLLTAANDGSLKMWNFNNGEYIVDCFCRETIDCAGRACSEVV